MREIYFDNSATTRPSEAVRKVMLEALDEGYGNPSSMHRKGFAAENAVKDAAAKIARTLKCDEKEILFTSGGTESDNLAVMGTADAAKRVGKHLITTCIEHPAILNTMIHMESLGYEVTYLQTDHTGRISAKELEQAIRPDTVLVSVMMVNNEIGTREPVEEIGEIIKRKNPNTLFHVDAVQGYGKYRLNMKKNRIDLLSVSGHKIHGPKGIGFLYIRSGVKINPIIFGGEQQKGLRSGTENVPGIAGMGTAAEEIYRNYEEETERLYGLKERLCTGLKLLPGVTLNGPEGRDGAPHVVSASFEGVRAEVLLHALEDKGIYVSAGSACASNHPGLSGTLMAVGVRRDLLESTIRFSFGMYNTEEEVDVCLKALAELLPNLRKFTRR